MAALPAAARMVGAVRAYRLPNGGVCRRVQVGQGNGGSVWRLQVRVGLYIVQYEGSN